MHDRHDTDLYAALRFANDVQPEQRRWLWPARIPLGKLTLLIGDPGVGKSLLATDLAARVSAGLPWPDTPNPQSPISNLRSAPSVPSVPSVASSPHHGVILVCPEDGPADTLQPRLTAAGADLASICILEGVTDTLPSSFPPEPRTLNPEPSLLPLSLPAHADILEQAIRAVNQPRLVILDPLHALLSADAQARLDVVVGRLAETAERYMVAIVAVCHMVKARAHRTLYRVRGSSALIAGARAAHLLAADPHEPDRRILCPLKTVYAPPAPALAFRIVPGPRLEWHAHPLVRESLLAPGQAGIPSGPQPLCGTADPALSRGWSASPDLLDLSGDAQSALSDASAWLLDYLAAGPRPARKVLRAARAAGVSIATLRRAKRICRVRSVKPDLQSAWLWSAE